MKYKKLLVLSIFLMLASTACGKKNKEPNREPVSTTSLTESSVVSENTSYIEEEVDGIKIDENTFPDEIFRKYVENYVDENNDGILTYDEINKIELIDINGVHENKYSKIKNLEGIEIFQNLMVLNCIDCDLTNIDISKNVNLEKLNVRKTNLKELDVSKNVNLKILICSNTGISNLDISNNSLLKQLEISTTYIKNVELSNNKLLYSIDVSDTELSDLDLSNNSLLKYLWINKTKIERVDLSNNPELERFSCYNASSFKDVDFSNNPMLLSVVCNGSAISKLYLTNNPKCFYVECNKDTEIIGGDNIEYLTRY